jgi:trimeric autotransporter adhesin
MTTIKNLNMNKRKLLFLLICAYILATIPSCKKYYVNEPTDDEQTNNSHGSEAADDYVWDSSKIIHIVLNGNSITSDNAAAEVSGTKVTITSPGTYSITGTLTDGQIIVSTLDSAIVRIILNGANITCSTSAPVFIKNAGKVLIVLADATDNYITDGKSYALNSDNEPSAAIFSKSYLSFYGSGSLTLTANYNDGITSKDGLIIKSGTLKVTSKDDGIRGKDFLIVRNGNITINTGGDGLKSDNTDAGCGYISVETGTINITSVNDGIHAESSLVIKEGTFVINNTGDVVLTASGSGYDPSYSEGIKCKTISVSASANITIRSTGKAGKGISSDGDVNITGGTLNITTTGAGATYKTMTGITDSYNASCITSNGNISILGGSVTTSSSGLAGKGIKSDGTLIIGDANNSPIINVTTTGAKFLVSGNNYDQAKAIKAVGAITVNNGTVTVSSADDGMKSETSITINNGIVSITKSVEGMEAPSIMVNSGNVSIVSSDDGFNATKGLTAGGTEQNDGSLLTINAGNIVVNSSAGDPLDSNGNIVITGGTIVIHGPQSSPEVGMDVNGTCNVSGGLLIMSGTNSNMTEGPSTTSSQYSILAMSTSNIAASTLFHIQDASGTDIVTFKPIRSYYSIVCSSSGLKSGSTYSIYTGGTSTGTNNSGLYTGGAYSGGTLKKSFTISAKLTNVSF